MSSVSCNTGFTVTGETRGRESAMLKHWVGAILLAVNATSSSCHTTNDTVRTMTARGLNTMAKQ